MPEETRKSKMKKDEYSQFELFREEAIEGLTSPEELTVPFMPVTYRKSLVVSAIAVILLLAAGWLVFGHIPIFIDGRGIVMNRKGLFSVEAKAAGIVSEILVAPGDIVHEGQTLLRLADPEKEKQYLSALNKYDSLKIDVSKLQEQIEVELTAQKKSILEQINAAKESIKEIQRSIVQLEADLKTKQELFKQHLLGLNQLYDAQQLLSQRKVELATTQGTLATLEANLTKSYRQQEMLGKERDLLQAKQDVELLKFDLEELNVTSSQNGVVLEILVAPGDRVLEGAPLVRLEYGSGMRQSYIFYAFIPVSEGKAVKIGTPVHVELSTVRTEEYGSILGHVAEISPYPVSKDAIGKTIQNKGLVDYLMGGNDTVLQIIIDPELDPKTPSGYKWTSGVGPPIKISIGTVCEVKGLAGRISPLFYLISLSQLEKLQTDVEEYFKKR